MRYGLPGILAFNFDNVQPADIITDLDGFSLLIIACRSITAVMGPVHNLLGINKDSNVGTALPYPVDDLAFAHTKSSKKKNVKHVVSHNVPTI